MTRGKPLVLSRKPGSETRAARKRAAESAFAGAGLPVNPPAELKDAPAGRAAWRALARVHSQIPGDLVSGLDRNFLVGYCLAVEGRQRALELERIVTSQYIDGIVELDSLLRVRAELRMSIRLVTDLEKQIYGTPKSRGGVSPAQREISADELIGELEKLGIG